jgi:hypothetical protein
VKEEENRQKEFEEWISTKTVNVSFKDCFTRHADVCILPSKNVKILCYFFHDSDRTFLRQCLEIALTGVISVGKYKGETLNQMCDLKYMTYWQYLINLYGKNPSVDLVATIFFPHLSYR